MPRTLTLLLVTLTAGCSRPGEVPATQHDAPNMASHAEVRQHLESYYSAFSARDWERFEQHFWPGATMTSIWMPLGETSERVVTTSIPDFVAQAPDGPGSAEIFDERLVSAQIRTEGGLAQAWTRYSARFGDPGDVLEWQGTDAFTLIRHQGEWRIASLAYLADDE